MHQAHDALVAIRREIAELARRRADAENRADYLRHVAREIDEAKLSEGEDVRLEDEARRLENAADIRETAATLTSMLEDDESGALGRLGQAARSLQHLVRLDPTLARLLGSVPAGG